MALQIEMCVVSVFLALLSAIRASCSDGVGTLQPACFNASCWIRVIVTANALDAMSSCLCPPKWKWKDQVEKLGQIKAPKPATVEKQTQPP